MGYRFPRNLGYRRLWKEVQVNILDGPIKRRHVSVVREIGPVLIGLCRLALPYVQPYLVGNSPTCRGGQYELPIKIKEGMYRSMVDISNIRSASGSARTLSGRAA